MFCYCLTFVFSFRFIDIIFLISGPVEAVKNALKAASLSLSDMDLCEVKAVGDFPFFLS